MNVENELGGDRFGKADYILVSGKRTVEGNIELVCGCCGVWDVIRLPVC